MHANIFTILTGFAALAAAYTTPKGDSPSGNPIIKPGLGDIVPVGSPYTITWQPTTPTTGTVTLVLLKGPPSNAVPQYAIVEAIPNSGSYSWTPKADTEPTAGTTGYGIQLIVDADGSYQYTTQFGISNPGYSAASSVSSVLSSASSAASSIAASASSAVASISASASAHANGTITASAGGHVASTGFPVANSSVISPTKSMSVPASLKTSTAAATSAPAATASAAAGAVVRVGGLMGLLAGAAVLVL